MMHGVLPDVFKEPAIKLFCCQLKSVQLSSSSQGNGNQTKKWLVPLKSSLTGKEIYYPFRSIWLQGIIHSILSDSEVYLKDVSNEMVQVIDCNKMAGGSDWIVKGMLDKDFNSGSVIK